MSWNAQTSRARFVRALAILAVGSCGWTVPPHAVAQLSPVPVLATAAQQPPAVGGIVVSITSPFQGARVSGAATLSASASTTGSIAGIQGVQFQIDGVDFGPEDTSAPYATSWDTTSAAEGWHTLSAVARDAGGNRYVSDPVTVRVANAAAQPSPVTRYEETDASIAYSGGWLQRTPDWYAWSGGAVMQATTPGAQATFHFSGTSVTWIGYRCGFCGIARVFADGVLLGEVDLFARTNEASARVFSVTGLTNDSHTLTIEATGRKNSDSLVTDLPFPLIVIDAFDVPAQAVSHLQETDPDVSYTSGWAGGDASKSWSGQYAAVSTTTGARATLTFTGTGIRWIGYRGPDAGTARVYLDGRFAGEVDAYSEGQRIQDTLFAASGLADARHTLAIEATGTHSGSSSGNLIAVDAFDVTSPGIRFEETDWSVTYGGNWIHGNRNKTWSEGTAAASDAPGARATFVFTGTAVSWIGCRKHTTGIARVYLDGAFVSEIDTYSPTEGYQDTVLRLTGLAPGRHALAVEATGRKNPAAVSAYVVVDAFDVRP
jgi:hypothetical protein